MEPEIVATPAPAPAMRCDATVQETELVEARGEAMFMVPGALAPGYKRIGLCLDHTP